jgi:hypothetical protein
LVDARQWSGRAATTQRRHTLLSSSEHQLLIKASRVIGRCRRRRPSGSE